VAACLRRVRDPGGRLGGRVLSLVSGRSSTAPGRERGRAGLASSGGGDGLEDRCGPLEALSLVAQRLAALRPVFLPGLWLLLLHHGAADLSGGGASRQAEPGGLAGGPAVVLRRPGL